MALVLTERNQGVNCAHIRAHMPNASRIRQSPCTQELCYRQLLAIRHWHCACTLSAERGASSLICQTRTPQPTNSVRHKAQKTRGTFPLFWPVLPLANCFGGP